MESTKTKPKCKSRSKRYFFMCFSANDILDPPHRKAKTTDPLLSYIALAEKQGIVLPTILSSVLTAAKGGAGDGSANCQKKIAKERSLRIRQALIAALNHTTLGKKIINRTITKNNTWSKSRVNKLGVEGDNKISNTNKKVPPNGTNSYTNSSSNYSPAFTRSTLSSTCSTSSHVLGSFSDLHPNPPINGIGMKQEMVRVSSRKMNFGINMGMYLLLFTSLLVLIFWGKIFAILCTSIGFFVVPYCRRKWCNERDVCEKRTEFDSAQYKEKLLEGE